MSAGTVPPEICRSQVVWYDDGNFIIRAEKTLFRVYGGLIAAQSTVFADMFKMPARPHGFQETVEGCPIVCVHDPAEDICRLLRAMHDPQYYVEESKTSFDVIECVLRLSTKYDVAYFRKRAIEQLSAMYPAFLGEYHKAAGMRFDVELGHYKGLRTMILARTLDIPLLLPSSLFAVTMNRMSVLLDGGKCSDGQHFELTWADKRLCIAARTRLMRAYQSRVLGYARALVLGNIVDCKRPGNCASKAAAELMRIVDTGEKAHWFLVAGETVWKQVELCETCRAAFIKCYDKGCQEIWEALPSYFNLGSWDSLKRPVE